MKFFATYRKSFILMTFPLIFFLCSCESVREYVKTQQQLYEDDVLVSETNTLTRDGKVIESSSLSFYEFQDDCNDVETHSYVSKSYSEKVTVRSSPNGGYIFYQILGKPFVILGASIVNVLKCGGYAFVNFLGGYNFATGSGNSLWYLPSYSESKKAADKAKEANRIKYYPEYHLPFTNNHITVEKFDRDISAQALAGENAEIITPVEIYEFDNTMSVNRSASADAASTAGVAGVIGTVVTIPVSVVTWVGGVAMGVSSQRGR